MKSFAEMPFVSWPHLNVIKRNERRWEYCVATILSVFNLLTSKIRVFNLLSRKKKLVYKQLKKQ
jgi:hypothetical protein